MKTLKESAVEYTLKKKKMDGFRRAKITTSRGAANYARNFYSDDIGIYESTFILMFDRSMNTIGYAKISQGGVSGTVVDIRIILKYAVESLATGVMLFHNHPSGSLNPSPQDINITKKLQEAMRWMDILLLDHIILTEDAYYSFADEGVV